MKLINPLIIIRILSTIVLIEVTAFISCLPVAYIYKEPFRPFLLASAIALLLFFILNLSTERVKNDELTNRDGFIAVSLSWLVFSALGTLPYIISGYIPSFIDAFFETTSGVTTTGASILTDVEKLSRSILYWRSLTHWIGGLGIIVLVIIILPSLKVTGYHLFSLESSFRERIHPKTSAIGYRIMYIYIGLTLTEIILLYAGGMPLFDSICDSYSTIATGGFSTKNTSLSLYSSYSQYIVMTFMFLAGTSQVVFYYFFKFNFRKVIQNEEFWFYLGVTCFSGVLVMAILLFNTSYSFEEAFRHSFYNVVSLITTTGSFSVDYIVWPVPALMIMFLLLFTGASTGSTTGNIKMARHLIMLKNIKNIFHKLNHPNALSIVKFNGKIIHEGTNITIISFVILYMFFFVVGSILLVTSGHDIITGTSAVAACLGNIGPGLGNVGPAFNYANFSNFDKVVLSLIMIIGRLEIITFFTLFTRSFWKI